MALRSEQIDLKLGLLHVNRLKNGMASTHPLRGPELRALRRLQRDYPASPYVFTTERHGPHHADRAEMWDRAVGYFRQVAAKAMGRSANRAAADSLGRALAALGHLPENRDTTELAIDLHFASRDALWPLGEHERVSEHLGRAESLATVALAAKTHRTLAATSDDLTVAGGNRYGRVRVRRG